MYSSTREANFRSLSRTDAEPGGYVVDSNRRATLTSDFGALLTMITTVDLFLDHQTMYRLVLYYLIALRTAFVLGFFRLAQDGSDDNVVDLQNRARWREDPTGARLQPDSE